ncbi:MAG: carbohydrate-binding family 9-like protein [Candidatus Brocadiae bacterium]|nr:carbohydrate-binding family 9-like protein [Candidatus Brocadiia bacterium]
MRRIVLGAVLLGLLCAGCGRPQATLKSRKPRLFQCRRAPGKIVIDGQLEPAWERAQVLDDFRVPGFELRPLDLAMARMLWDDENLYVAVTMEDRDVYAVKTQHDGQLWLDDVAEVFLKPDEAKHIYYEFEVNAAGATLDMLIARRGAGHFDRWWPWESSIKAKVSIQGTLNEWRDSDKGWIAEIAIPLAAFKDAAPKVQLGDRWRFAICRYNYSVYLPGREPSSTAPLTRADFHRHEEYDFVEFAE